jgi:hypothetical protein
MGFTLNEIKLQFPEMPIGVFNRTTHKTPKACAD